MPGGVEVKPGPMWETAVPKNEARVVRTRAFSIQHIPHHSRDNSYLSKLVEG